MTEEAQQIAIAEACEWVNQGRTKGVPALNHRWANPSRNIGVGNGLPINYHNDLNAMHEAEKILDNYQRTDYIRALNKGDFSYRRLAFATAAQRAEAFLRTIGKWDEQPEPK